MRIALPAALAACVLTAAPARADAIDGHWCHDDGRRMEIAGPTIVTPGRNRVQGQYDRHYFSYTAPANEPGAGAAIDLALMGEMRVRLKRAGGTEEDWRRCGPPIS
jgi:hypothetical protein